MKKKVVCLFFCLSLLAMTAIELYAVEPFVFETDDLKCVVSTTGKTEAFIDKRTGQNCLRPDADQSFCILRVKKTGSSMASCAVEQQGKHYRVRFRDPATQTVYPVQLLLAIEPAKNAIYVRVVSVTGGDFYAIELFRATLNIDYAAKDSFAGTAMSANLHLSTVDYPGKSTRIGGKIFQALGYDHAGMYVLGMPEAQLRNAMKDIAKTFKKGEMPISTTGGPFAKDIPVNKGSYIITTSSIVAEDVPKWIASLKKYGIDQVDFHQGGAFRQGDFLFNPQAYPNGVADFRRTSDAFRKEGIVTGLHTYSQFLPGSSRYVTPVPHKDLDVMRTFTLTHDIPADSKELSVNESTADISTVTGFLIRNSLVLRIDDELIRFDTPKKEAPFGFTNCTRGYLGTKATSHARNAKVDQLTQFFFLFAPKPGSELFFEIARNTAKTYNEGGFGMIYLDALDGTHSILEDKELVWYYDSLFVNEILKYVNNPPLLEYSTMNTMIWYPRSRMGAWDSPHKGYQHFFDRHVTSNRESADRFYLPGQFGWLALCPTSGDNMSAFQKQHFFLDDMHALGSRILANDYGLSWLGFTLEKMPPLATRIANVVRMYDRLRRDCYFPENTLRTVRESQQPVVLVPPQNDSDRYHLCPAHYTSVPLTLNGKDNPAGTVFDVDNKYEPQVPLVRLEVLWSALPWDDPSAVSLIESDENQPMKSLTTKTFAPELDLSKHLAMGLWIFGDHGKQTVNIRVDSPAHMNSGHNDHYINIDFSGWKYFELCEAENGQCEKAWPISCGSIYSEFREKVYYNNVNRVVMMVSGKSDGLRMKTLKAIPSRKATIVNPVFDMGGNKIQFPGKIESGQYLEWVPGSDAIVYDSLGNEIAKIKPNGNPVPVKSGVSTWHLLRDNVNESARVRVTVRALGKPIE